MAAMPVMSAIPALCLADLIVMEDEQVSVIIDPAQLAIEWQENGETYQINDGLLNVDGQRQRAKQVTKTEQIASWKLAPSGLMVGATLLDGELWFEFNAGEKGIDREYVLNWFSMPGDLTQALLLPFNEGLYVPTDHDVWADYLPRFSGSDTTQGLKMPFWSKQVLPQGSVYQSASLHSVDESSRFVSFLMANPFNNQLSFDRKSNESGEVKGNLIEMQASHHFKPVSGDEPFRLLISVGDHPLAGAKRYKEWRIKQGEAETLAEKMKAQPGIEQLIGASHVYLFGSGLLAVEDVRDWDGFGKWFVQESGMVEYVDDQTRKDLEAAVQANERLNRYQQHLLIKAINSALPQHIPTDSTPNDMKHIRQQYQMAQAHREYLEQNAGDYLLPSEIWGQGLSQGMVDTLQDAGIEKLWLGVGKWMTAFYQPDVVNSARDQGYLVATYDSYNTGIPEGVNDSWISAHLPDKVRERCAIVQADGTKQSGFRGNGYYQNPACGRKYAQRRMEEVIQYGQFDSYFIDVDATGMVRDDFNELLSDSVSIQPDEKYIGMPQSAMAEAYNDRMDWISRHQPVVLGSEDGSSITTRGIAFAHGMETVGFGWRDPDMTRNRQSPYYLGAWYPEHKPAYFFKSAEVKEPFKTVFFSPEFKVPLYQTVFHDEVINSHHWHSDSVKFSDVQAIRDLASMLYVTPAMIHLSRDEATSSDSPRVKALQHYQSAYQSLHEALWDKQLTEFGWLNDEGSIQKVTFNDGSSIVANFTNQQQRITLGNKTLRLQPESIKALLAEEDSEKQVLVWQHIPFAEL